MRRVPTFVLASAAILAAGCSSQWYPGFAKADVAHTDVVVRTEPAGATVLFNGVEQSAKSPIRIPVKYNHVETVWVRQTNAGITMREGMSPLVQVLTFPVWLVASFFHSAEEIRRHEYGGNVHTVGAYSAGHDETQETIKLEGEAEHEVRLVLPKTK